MSFVDADPTALVYARLRAHPGVLAAFGSAEHITGLLEAPWPHLLVRAGADDVGDMVTSALSGEVTMEVWGHPDGREGRAALRRLLLVALEAVGALAQEDTPDGQPVVYGVTVVQPPGPLPLANGQERWAVTVAVTLNPPQG